MKLYYKPGACSLASRIVLTEAAAEFSAEKVDTENAKTESGADYGEINPLGYVPALQLDDGDVVTENPAILQYLGDRFPALAMVPQAGSLDRVRIQELLNFLSSELHKAYSPFFTGTPLTADERTSVLDRMRPKLDHVAKLLADGRTYLTGSNFTVADAYAFVILNWSNFIDAPLDAWPSIQAYMARVADRPAVHRALVDEGLAA